MKFWYMSLFTRSHRDRGCWWTVNYFGDSGDETLNGTVNDIVTVTNIIWFLEVSDSYFGIAFNLSLLRALFITRLIVYPRWQVIKGNIKKKYGILFEKIAAALRSRNKTTSSEFFPSRHCFPSPTIIFP